MTYKTYADEENNLKRLEYVLSFIDEDTLRFEYMNNIIHVDEKWFYDDIDKRSCLVFENKSAPQRSRRSKHFMSKVMFLAAIPQPRRFIDLRRSRYRGRDETCLRNIESVTRPVYKSSLLDGVILAIKACWPRDGWNIRLLFQPPNSPDMSCLDLVVASLQAKQHQKVFNRIENRINPEELAYTDINDVVQDNIFLTLQALVICVLREGGDNQYKIPHMNKAKLYREKNNLCSRRIR
ncbi:Hypothetical protein PHPALM_16806 [Phytophthora palmivora]|uniref:Transposase n=1 Tax=Phytophthora palmivora TaxID=4796 RepID=A0A2P4XNX1_9STRA|nr:Hypothetical protein PHPALM_16806 [Phytophthora palmivora]